MTPIPPDARALTIRQPWASLIALGVKTIETRSWRTDYRGPLVIRAGAKEPERGRVGRFTVDCFTTGHDFYLKGDDGLTLSLHLGAVVAVVDLVDVVPIIDDWPLDTVAYVRREQRTTGVTEWWLYNDETGRCADVTGQEPYGDFAPGHYAWILDRIRPVTPVPAKGRQGLWRPDAGLMQEVRDGLQATGEAL